MIEIKTTVSSLKEAEKLLEADVDYLYFGEEQFGLRLSRSFSRQEQKQLVELAKIANKKVSVAVNGIMHPDKMLAIPRYLSFLEEIGVDELVVGDPGIIYTLKKNNIQIPYVYGGEMLVTSARQINFWGKRGAIGAVIAHEVPYLELIEMLPKLEIFSELQVYGATCIHQSKRRLLQNYMNFTSLSEEVNKERMLYLSEPNAESTHYSIYEDQNGTHIFANHDTNLSKVLDKLSRLNINRWKLEGIYCPEDQFIEITKFFVQAKECLMEGSWTQELAAELTRKIEEIHPKERSLSTGFFEINPKDIK